ncbi:MAG: NAD(+) diphosphatase, partial [Stomatobaculum longum]|nr:NAD(+) diphosphatase [Stomatobaculum longum]
MIQDIAPHHYDVSYHTERTPARRSFLVLVAREGVLFRATDDGFTLPRFADFET